MQGIFLIITISVLVANFLADIAYLVLDPRTRREALSDGDPSRRSLDAVALQTPAGAPVTAAPRPRGGGRARSGQRARPRPACRCWPSSCCSRCSVRGSRRTTRRNVVRDILQPPSSAHWFGTTHLGQDIFSQLLVGTRSVIFVGFLAGLVATALSVPHRCHRRLPGRGGRRRALRTVQCVPGDPRPAADHYHHHAIQNSAATWSSRTSSASPPGRGAPGVLRAQTLSLRHRDYVEAARATGESHLADHRCSRSCRTSPPSSPPSSSARSSSPSCPRSPLAFIGIPGISDWNWGEILFWAQGQQALPRAPGGGSCRPGWHRAARHRAVAGQLRHRRVRQPAAAQRRPRVRTASTAGRYGCGSASPRSWPRPTRARCADRRRQQPMEGAG